MDKKELASLLRIVPDYPIPGIMFFDVTTLMGNAEAFCQVVDDICDLYRDKGITKVVGIESRGFICAAAVAKELGAGFVPIRKPGKLPARTLSQTYAKEYGTDTIQIHADSIGEDDVVLIHDDILATGGTAIAAVSLVRKMHPRKIYSNFLLRITDIPTSAEYPEDIETTAILELAERP